MSLLSCRCYGAPYWRYIRRRYSFFRLSLLSALLLFSLVVFKGGIMNQETMKSRLIGMRDMNKLRGVRFPIFTGQYSTFITRSIPSNLNHTRLLPIINKKKPPTLTIKESSGPLSYMNITPIKQEQEARIERLINGCHGNQSMYIGLSSRKWAYERLEIHEESNLLYCPLLKVGSTFWRRILHALKTKSDIHTPYDISINKALSTKGKQFKHMLARNDSTSEKFLGHASKFMFVREPFARLLSGYTDKLFAPNPYFWALIGRYIIRNFRVNATDLSRRCGHDVTFAEFVKYVIYTEEYNTKERNGHFTPTYDQCKPCQIKYNIIGKMETFLPDTYYVMNVLGFNISQQLLKEWEHKAEEDAILDSTASPFSWKKQISKCMTMYEAGKRIWRKMQIRGIIDRNIPLPFGSLRMNTVSSTNFIKALILARQNSKHVRKIQKRQALIDAFSQVSLEDKRKIQQLFRPDFELFGYDIEPKYIFNTEHRSRFKSKYFDIKNP